MKPFANSSVGRLRRVLASLLLAATSLGVAGAEVPGQISVHPAHPDWLFYHLEGPYFLAGPGDPEGFLYRGTRNPDGTRDGDQIELIDKLAPTGANSIYLMAVRSNGGDGGPTEDPFIDNDPELGLSDAVLDQWGAWFEAMDSAGITIFFFLYDDGSLIWDTGDTVGADEAAFIQGLVDRFEHLEHLIWVIAEEYQERYSPARISAIAAEIKAADDNRHPVAVHKLSGLDFSEFADDPSLDQFAIQYNVPGVESLHSGVEIAWADADRRYNLNLSEAADWGSGTTARHKAWAAAMAGAYVMVFEMDIETTSTSDMEDLGRLRTFMESTDFYTMEPRDDLARENTDYVLARDGKSYIVYARNGSGSLGLGAFVAGTYDLEWLDAVTGTQVVQTDVQLDAGTQSWSRPAGIGPEAVVYALRTDGPNDPPEVLDQFVATTEARPVAVRLGFLDPDGPGPHSYTVESDPTDGELAGVPPDLTYTPNAEFDGTDSFTWRVSDGVESSRVATVEIDVLGNQPPTASSFSATALANAPLTLPFSENSTDPEGEPLTFSILTPPAHGTASEVEGEWIYTPDPGFSGQDFLLWQANDGSDPSNPASASISVSIELMNDDFNRGDSETLDNGWVEVEGVGTVAIDQQALIFEAIDETELPLTRRSFDQQIDGMVSWSFELDFERTGNEGTYAFHMQLGELSSMSDVNPDDSGVAVHLIWSGPSGGLSEHQTLGYVAGGNTFDLGSASGPQTVAVEVNLDLGVYSVSLEGAVFETDLPLAPNLPIDTVRFYTDSLNSQNFPRRWIDNVQVSGTRCSATDGVDLVLENDTISTVESFEACSTIHVGPAWSVIAPGSVHLKARGAVVLENGVSIVDGAELTIGNSF